MTSFKKNNRARQVLVLNLVVRCQREKRNRMAVETLNNKILIISETRNGTDAEDLTQAASLKFTQAANRKK